MAGNLNREAIRNVVESVVPVRVLLEYGVIDLKKVPAEPGENVEIQTALPVCKGIEVVGEGDHQKFYGFEVSAGIRFINLDELNEDKTNYDDCVIGQILSDFRAIYALVASEPCEEGDLKEFGMQNAPHNVWPYWREFVQSTCLRAGVEPPSIGMHLIERYQKGAEENRNSEEKEQQKK